MTHYSIAPAPSRAFLSPHFKPAGIPVEFAALHYTAQSFQESLKIFLNPEGPKLSCHLLIDEAGRVFELVSCWRGERHKAFHAGKSEWTDSSGKIWRNFNDFSIGIELVNWNGNFCPYTESQYQSLCQVLSHLKGIYPALRDPERILGHEHVAGFRGKSDPGRLFDWKRLFEAVFQEPEPRGQKGRRPRLTEKQQRSLSFLAGKNSPGDKKAKKISLILESPLPFWLKKIHLRFLSLDFF